MFPWQTWLRWDKGARWCVCMGGWGFDRRQSASITHTYTHTCMGTNNHPVMVECVCVTDRQVRGLVVTWLSVELCCSYLLWPLTSIPPQPLCEFLWCIYTNVNVGQLQGEKLDRVKKLSNQNHLFWFNNTMKPLPPSGLVSVLLTKHHIIEAFICIFWKSAKLIQIFILCK